MPNTASTPDSESTVNEPLYLVFNSSATALIYLNSSLVNLGETTNAIELSPYILCMLLNRLAVSNMAVFKSIVS